MSRPAKHLSATSLVAHNRDIT
ncbi:hypothetical protein CGLO_00249 [Colletotrichum gloeosporioides Cg-14]|uniref:Uncharacterized protein n=1 Tax=Colletotrichum gloeosporioides (strain Cg-14) TaxID=1237896 RepID=T0KV01_COLGC|nr:hypothetical protein CGLO_00249 [Colletotrichum gloeosporioides Cg-14]